MSDARYYISTGEKNCFYTLRYRFSEPTWIQGPHGATAGPAKERDYHICNLSIDRDEAIRKAKERTGKDLTADFDLSKIDRRKNVDWSIFQFGHHIGESIHEVKLTDPDYLIWVAENMRSDGRNGETVELITSLMSHELGERKDARDEAAQKAEALRAHRISALSEVIRRMPDGNGGFRDSITDSLKRGEELRGRGITIACEILAKECGRRNSKAYLAEYERIASIFENAGKFHSTQATDCPVEKSEIDQSLSEQSPEPEVESRCLKI